MKTLTTERLTEMLTKARGLLAVLVLTVSLPAVALAPPPAPIPRTGSRSPTRWANW